MKYHTSVAVVATLSFLWRTRDSKIGETAGDSDVEVTAGSEGPIPGIASDLQVSEGCAGCARCRGRLAVPEAARDGLRLRALVGSGLGDGGEGGGGGGA